MVIAKEAAISMTSATTGGMEGEGGGAAMGVEGVIAMVAEGGEPCCDMRYLACVLLLFRFSCGLSSRPQPEPFLLNGDPNSPRVNSAVRHIVWVFYLEL